MVCAVGLRKERKRRLFGKVITFGVKFEEDVEAVEERGPLAPEESSGRVAAAVSISAGDLR